MYVATTIAVVALVNAIETTKPVLAVPLAAPVALVRLSPTEAGQFQRALASLAGQAHVALIAEGAPLFPKLVAAKIPNLTAEISLDQAVSHIATAYDYDAQRRGNVFILTKRYTNSRDLPCVTLKECRQAADTLSNVLNVFNPHFATSIYANGPDGERDAVFRFFQSLSPPQMQAAQDKKLYYGSLLPDQQTLIQGLFLDQYVQMPLSQVQNVIGYLDYAPQSSLKARNQDGYSGLFMEIPSLYPGTPPALFSLVGGLTPLDQPQPSMLRTLPLPKVSPFPLESTTLGKIVSSLAAVNGQLPAIDVSLVDKPVTAAGINNADSLSMLNALSVLYGLDLEAHYKERPRLEPRYVPLPTSLKEIDAAVWASLPVSYARALHIDLSATTSSNAATPAVAAPDYQSLMRSMQFPTSFQQEANNRLLLAIQPQLKKQGLNVRVPVSSLNSDAQAALAISLMTELITTLHNGFSGSPHQSVLDCIDNMDQTVIYTTPGEDAHINNQDVPSLYLQGTDPYTKQHVGLGGVRYFSSAP